jgi:hypothetical protein
MSEEMSFVFKQGKQKLKGNVYYDDSLPKALGQAQSYAGRKGYVASMPEIASMRIGGQLPWNNWFTAMSEEDVLTTPQGNHVVAVVHGGRILSTPERIRQAYDDGLVNGAAKLDTKRDPEETKKLLSGKEMPVYSIADFVKGVEKLPRQYAVILDFETAQKTQSGRQDADRLKDNPLVIARCGGVEQAAAYIDAAKKAYHTTTLGQWHPFANVDPEQRQGRLLFLGDGDSLSLLLGDDLLYNLGRFVGVAPEAHVAREARREKTPEKKVTTATLEQIMEVCESVGQKHVSESGQKQYLGEMQRRLRKIGFR